MPEFPGPQSLARVIKWTIKWGLWKTEKWAGKEGFFVSPFPSPLPLYKGAQTPFFWLLLYEHMARNSQKSENISSLRFFSANLRRPSMHSDSLFVSPSPLLSQKLWFVSPIVFPVFFLFLRFPLVSIFVVENIFFFFGNGEIQAYVWYFWES